MSRSRLMRSHSTDGPLRHTSSTGASDYYGNLKNSRTWHFPNVIYSHDSVFSPQYQSRYQQPHTWHEKQDIKFQSQPAKQRRVTWGATPKYSAERDRLADRLGDLSYGESKYSRSYRPNSISIESSCPIHGYSQAMRSTINRNHSHNRNYGSRLYPLNSESFYSDPSNRNRASGYYQTSSKLFGESNFETSRQIRMPSKYSSYSYLRNPLLDSQYDRSYGSFSHDQVKSMLNSQSSFARAERPTWRGSFSGLTRLSLYD